MDMTAHMTIRTSAIEYLHRFTSLPDWNKWVRHYHDYNSNDFYFSDLMHAYNEVYNDAFDASGAEKTAIIFDDFDWVIKFMTSVDDSKTCDACMVEAYNYADAVKNGLDKFFAPTYFLTEVGGIKFYIQKKCRSDEYVFECDIEDYLRGCGNDTTIPCDGCNCSYRDGDHCNGCDNFDREYGDPDTTGDWLAHIYGDEYGRFYDFCDSHDINDIHCANIAYCGDRIVVIDFSGFHGEMWFGDWYESSDKTLNIKI